MTFAFDSDFTADTFRSISSLVKNNNGVYRSAKQKKYFENFLLSPACPAGSDLYGIPLNEGARWVMCEYTTRWAEYGSRSVIPGAFIFVFDEFGVVAKIKLPFDGNMRDGARPAPGRKVTQWTRPLDVVTPDFVGEEAKRIETEKAAASLTNHIGEIDSRIKVVGKVVSVRSFEKKFRAHYYDSGVGYITTLDVDGNTVTYFGELNTDMKDSAGYKIVAEEGDVVEFMARVKDHTEYKGKKQTVITRPTKIKMVKKAEETV